MTDTTPTHQQQCGHNVAEARARQRLSQLALAVEAGTTQQTISRIEAGTQVPSDRMKVRIAKALGVPTVELFPYAEDDA